MTEPTLVEVYNLDGEDHTWVYEYRGFSFHTTVHKVKDRCIWHGGIHTLPAVDFNEYDEEGRLVEAIKAQLDCWAAIGVTE